MKMRRVYVLSIALLATVPGLGRAQAAPEVPSESHKAAIVAMLEAMQMRKTIADSMEKTMGSQLQSNPMLAGKGEQLQAFFQKLASWDTIEDDIVRIYCASFSEKEAQLLTRFFGTRLGKRFSEEQANVSAEISKLMQQKVQQNMGELMKMMSE